MSRFNPQSRIVSRWIAVGLPRLAFLSLVVLATATSARAQTSAVTYNNANPAASVQTNTTGGTNINYQTNNQWSNEMGFGPGIFCRTPTFALNVASAQQTYSNNDEDRVLLNSNHTGSYNANMGVVIPWGSTVQRDCKRLVEQIARDREISSDLSMIRACASLVKEGIQVDPNKFPTLSRCEIKDGDPPLTVSQVQRRPAVRPRPVARPVQRRPAPMQPIRTNKTEVIKN
tara:strand:- start:309 stop:998 length:690 start_codon:yes stop_codon:yes gene_type:complete